jgi:hypothetical protein
MFPEDAAEAAAVPGTELVVESVSPPGQRYTLRLFPDGFRIDPEDDRVEARVHLRRTELSQIDLVDTPAAPHTLVVRAPRKRLFRFQTPAWPVFLAWLGREALFRMALRKRLAYAIPLGIVMALTGLPLPGNPAAGVPGTPFDPLWTGLGLLLVGNGLVARQRPHPALFLSDALWLVLMAGTLVWWVLQGRNVAWLILVVLQVHLAWKGVGLYQEFRKPA